MSDPLGSTFGVRAGAWLIAVALSAVLLFPICDFYFGCGCRLPGLGGHAGCDIHRAGLPDCPWCRSGWIWWALLGTSSVSSLVAVAVAPPRWGWAVPCATGAGLLALMAAGVITRSI